MNRTIIVIVNNSVEIVDFVKTDFIQFRDLKKVLL